MSSKDTSEPAFPSENGQYFGMSLRDYFAAKAMQALIAKDVVSIYGKSMAASAFTAADAMLQERDK